MKISRLQLEKIAANHGPSFYLLDSSQFRDNHQILSKSFQEFYPKSQIAYSYKTNYVPRFCLINDELGGYAEVVSSMEMDLALKLGVSPRKVFFNGPYKEQSYLEKLLRCGGVVNIDSNEELQRISDCAIGWSGPPFKLGIRCNFDVKDDVISRFGFDIDDPNFIKIVNQIDANPNLKLIGLHCHFATRTLECWRQRTLGIIELLDRHFQDRIGGFEYLSLGGGIYGRMSDELKQQFQTEIPSFDQYAAVAAKALAEFLSKRRVTSWPTLIIEPGTALVADAVKYVCQVNSIKRIKNRVIVSMTGSAYNINPNPNRKNVPTLVVPNPQAKDRQKIVGGYLAGYTCIEGDYLYKGFTGDLAVGDFVVFNDVGAYSVVMKPPFILPNVSIIEPYEDGENWAVIKRSELFEDIFSTFNICKSL
jgi:diaminopimelate decarboxylase